MTRKPVECPFCKKFLILDDRGLLPKHGSWTGKGTCAGAMLTPDEAKAAKTTPTKDPGFSI